MNDDVLVHFLLSQPGIAAEVGQRGYPYGLLPQKTAGQLTATLPALVVSGVSDISHHSAGESGRPELDCFRAMRFQVDVYGDSGADVARVSEQVRAALDGYAGMMSGVHVGGAWGRLATAVNRDPDTELFRRTLDFEIHVMGG